MYKQNIKPPAVTDSKAFLIIWDHLCAFRICQGGNESWMLTVYLFMAHRLQDRSRPWLSGTTPDTYWHFNYKPSTMCSVWIPLPLKVGPKLSSTLHLLNFWQNNKTEIKHRKNVYVHDYLCKNVCEVKTIGCSWTSIGWAGDSFCITRSLWCRWS